MSTAVFQDCISLGNPQLPPAGEGCKRPPNPSTIYRVRSNFQVNQRLLQRTENYQS